MKTSLIVASFALGTTFLATGCDKLPAGTTAAIFAKAEALKDKAMNDPRVQRLLSLDGRGPSQPQQPQHNGWNNGGGEAQGWDMPQAQINNGWDNGGWDMPQAQMNNGWDMPQYQVPQYNNGWDVPQYEMPQVPQGFDPAAFQQQQAQNAQGFNTYMQGIQADSARRSDAVDAWTRTVIRGE